MPQTVFFLHRLRPGIEPGDYEAWVESVDYPRVRTYASILEYSVMRITSGLEGEGPPYDYIERVVVTDIDEYQRERLAKPDRAEFRAQISRLVEPMHAFVVRQVGNP
jgi:hypothetical protein